jgi:hypothetical protein
MIYSRGRDGNSARAVHLEPLAPSAAETGILSEFQNQKTWMPDARANASIYQFRQDQHRDDEDVIKVNPFLLDPAGTATILFSRTGHHEDIGG